MGCNGVCGHYTQVVWAETTSVGCGYAICNGRDLVPSWTGDNAGYLVCQYSPPGNFVNRAPYMNGSPAASACPDGTTASGSLCEQNEETTHPHPLNHPPGAAVVAVRLPSL